MNLSTRRRVEFGVGVPGAGHFSRRILEACGHSAAARAGTVVDGQNQEIDATKSRRDHRGWSPHMAASRNKQAEPNQTPNGNFVISGEIGTNAMHPPGKRSMNINNWLYRVETHGPASAAWTSTIGLSTKQSQIETRGQEQRLHPTIGLFTAADRSNRR
jgi:hypothetical protein